MIPAFALERPTTISEAADLIDRYPDATFYNGGTELTLLLKLGLAQFDRLVDLKGIDELKGIRADSDGIHIGGAVTHAEVERSDVVRKHAPGLPHLERVLANIRVRSTGTLAGNLCFAEPHSDPAAFLIAWGAEIELATGKQRRRRPVEGFILGPLETDREPNEILSAIHLPPLPERTTVVHRKIAFIQRPAASVAVRLCQDHGRFRDVRIAVGSVGEIPALLPDAAAVLEGDSAAESESIFAEAARVAAATCEPFDDLNGSVEYKRHLVESLVREALQAAGQETTTYA